MNPIGPRKLSLGRVVFPWVLTWFFACGGQSSTSNQQPVSSSSAPVVLSSVSSSSPPPVAPSASAASSFSVSAGPSGSARAAAPPGPATVTSSSQQERERVLALLLTGNLQTEKLPEVATPPGVGFDPNLRHELTTVEIEVQTPSQTAKANVKEGAISANGALPKDVVRRILRQHFGRFRACYNQGLAANPDMQGTVTSKFVINQEGAVTAATAQSSGSLSPSVAACVQAAIRGTTFPQPESGVVTVTYPIIFSVPQ